MASGLDTPSTVHLRRSIGNGLAGHMSDAASLAPETVAVDPTPRRAGDDSTAGSDADALLRLGLWLADVAMETARATTAPMTGSTGVAADPPASGATLPRAAAN